MRNAHGDILFATRDPADVFYTCQDIRKHSIESNGQHSWNWNFERVRCLKLDPGVREVNIHFTATAGPHAGHFDMIAHTEIFTLRYELASSNV